MKLERTGDDHFDLRLTTREHRAFCNLLRAYPVTPLAHHRIRRQPASAATKDPEQSLLDEGMSAHKTEWRERVDRFLTGGHRFRQSEGGFRLELTSEEMEWLLQVLNDVRVGCWIKLGCPDPEAGTTPKLSAELLRLLPMMEMAGHFEYALLAALDGTEGLGWGGKSE
jgi:hypothetical protein